MTWVKLDEDFASHPKVIEAGPLGIALQVAALCYCNRHLTDGYIGRAAARSLLDYEGIHLAGGEEATAEDVAALLVEAGLWHAPGHGCDQCPEVGRGYLIHDYLDAQPSREDVLAKRAQAAAAGAKGGRARATKRTAKQTAKQTAKRNASEPLGDLLSGSSSGTSSESQAEDVAESNPVPVPVPVSTKTAARAASQFPHEEFWVRYPKRDGRKVEKKKSQHEWSKLSEDDRRKAMIAVEHYRADAENPAVHLGIKDAFRWLRDRTFEEFLEPRELDPAAAREERRLRSVGTGGVA